MNISYLLVAFICLILCIFSQAAPAALSVADIYVSKDAYLYFNSYGCGPPCSLANQNFGSEQTIHLAGYHLVTNGVLGYDISSLPNWDGKASSIKSIELFLPGLTSSSFAYVSDQCTITFYPMASSWTENGITANNFPTVNYTWSFSMYMSTSGGYKFSDITNYGKEVINKGGNLFSFYLRSDANCAFPSREANSPSFLRISYEGTASASVVCGSVTNCQACCVNSTLGPQCYSPSTHQCLTGYTGHSVCANNEALCGNTCYSPSSHTCISNWQLCPLNYLSCNGACYNPNNYGCHRGFFLCPAGMQYCASACYYPDDYNCVDEQLQPK